MNTDANIQYPEHEKLEKVKDQSHIIGEFLEWLDQRDYYICGISGGEFSSTYMENEQLLALYFGVDLYKLNKEKVAMLKAQREAIKQGGSDGR